jgi:hypothetical protein
MKSIDEAIVKAKTFVLNSRHPEDMMWHNFLTHHHGESADWVSSFVGLSLIQSGVPKEALFATAESVMKRQRENGGFSYNHKIVPDADSTAFAIRFLSFFGFQEELRNASKFLAGHQHSDGSYATYQEAAIRQYARIPPEMRVTGWCMGTPDITASAVLAFPKDEAGVKYLLDNQDQKGFWHSYWWTSDVYATAHAVEVLRHHGFTDEINAAQQWLADDSNVPKVPFYLALSVQSLGCNHDFRGTAESRVEQLLKMQRSDDGSWDVYPILRFPFPNNKEPWKDQSRWREDASDQNRVFTTAACLKTLNDYQKIISNQSLNPTNQ